MSGAAPHADRFAGASVLVTGGSRGIGREIALTFADQGASRVAIGYLRSDSAAEETAAAIRERGAEPIMLRGNVGDTDRLDEMLATVGELDVVVANAATGVIRPVLELTEKHWDWTMDANARSLFTIARLAASRLSKGSAIIALSSLGSTRVLDNYVLVGVSKAAIEALVRYLAVELAPREIRVNAVTAGLVDTDALEHFPDREEMLDFYRRRTPAGRLVAPADIADLVSFLASTDAKMIRGQSIVLDGGYSLIA
ncbi:MAG: SDR family oxidoreductase [Gaiellaceae bacterium]